MKFILKYLTCCEVGVAIVQDDKEALGKEEPDFVAGKPKGVIGRRETKRQNSRRDRTAAKSSEFPSADRKKKYSRLQWQPALGAISEDKVATERELESIVGGPEKIILIHPKLEKSATFNKKSAATNKVHDRSLYCDSPRWEGSKLMMPSLSPPIFAF